MPPFKQVYIESSLSYILNTKVYNPYIHFHSKSNLSIPCKVPSYAIKIMVRTK